MNLTGQKASQKPQKRIPNKGLQAHVESKPCVVCGLGSNAGRMTHHHLQTVGAGGIDEKNMVPTHWFTFNSGVYSCHTDYLHTRSTEQASKELGIDLEEYAGQLTEEYERREG